MNDKQKFDKRDSSDDRDSKPRNVKRKQRRGGGRSAPNKNDRRAADYKRDSQQEREQTGSLNDLSWYNRYPDLLASAGAIPYPYRPGMALPTSEEISVPLEVGTGNASLRGASGIPGVMALDWVPSVGISNTVTDPASVVCKEMYRRVRGSFSGSLEADAPDFLMYVMALDSIFAFIAHMKRIYRTISVWTPQNYVLPDTMLRAYGCSPAFITDVRANKTQFWGQINELVYQSRKFSCPAVMDIFNRHYWMSDNVYGDSAEPNAQFYCFRPAALYLFEELPLANDAATLGSGLHMTKLPAFSTGTEMFNFGLSMIEALVAWDEAYTINGYLKRAYEDTPTFVVQTLAQDEVLVPVYVPEVLTQIENATALPLAISSSPAGIETLRNPSATALADSQKDVFSGCNVTQNVETNAVISSPKFAVMYTGTVIPALEATGFFTADLPMVSIRSVTPTVADTVIASRLKAAIFDTSISTMDVGGLLVMAPVAGTEIPLAWTVYTADVTLQLPQKIFRVTAKSMSLDTTVNLPTYMIMEQFDWHPFVRMDYVTASSAQNQGYATTWIGDVHNATSTTVETLKQLHRVCVYSEFNAFDA